MYLYISYEYKVLSRSSFVRCELTVNHYETRSVSLVYYIVRTMTIRDVSA